MKVRVHELAKKYEIGNKEFLNLLKDLEIEVSSHLSGLSEDQVDKIKATSVKMKNLLTMKNQEKRKRNQK